MYLEKIDSPKDIKGLNSKELTQLAQEIRDALLFKLSKCGGHFGPNFGIVEATIALHYVFDSPKDKIVFDVSHQCYPHKMLTGRKDGFLKEEKFKSVTGYTTPGESEHDFFAVGHTSTSISLASGLAKARDLKGKDGNVIAVIGDGSLSGGEALEGLDYIGETETNFIAVINDNDMSIAENHGGLYKNLKLLRDTGGKAECNLFRAMGLDYIFVKNGNNLEELISAFRQVKDCKHPVAVHICTQKGKGYAPAEQQKENWHYCGPFDIKSGKPLYSADGGEDYHSITTKLLQKKMEKDKSIAVITSGTPAVTGFTQEERRAAGNRFIDVGIAEEHAVALASGIAAGGGKPVYAVYSTFLQRTYDQLSQDLCINSSPATILVFLASVYGMSDVTHLGIYDIPMLSNIPNLVYLAPTCREEYLAMLDWSMEQRQYPVAIRVPANDLTSYPDMPIIDYSALNKSIVTQEGSDIAIIALGTFYSIGLSLAKAYEEKTGTKPTLINPVYITGTDDALLEKLKESHRLVITLEDGSLEGGYGEKIARFYSSSDMLVRCYGLKKEFLDRYDVAEVLQKNHLTPQQILEDIK